MRPTVKAALSMALAVNLISFGSDGRAQAPSEAPPAQPLAPAAAPASTPAPEEALPVVHKPHHARPLAAAAPQPTLASVAARPGARLAPNAPIPPSELEALVDGVVRQAMSTDHIAGVGVSVVQNGRVILKKGYGFARATAAGGPVDPDRSLFRLGPVSQAFTWMVVMKEVETGHIRPTAPLNLSLPESLAIPEQSYKYTIDLNDLMTHTAGFESRRLGQLFEVDPRRIRPLIQYLRQERPKRVREAESLASPSDYESGLAGEAVSYVVGKPFEALVDSEIIHPLGLKHTTFKEPYPPRDDLPGPMPAALAADMAEGFRWSNGVFKSQPFGYASQIAPAEGASSTPGDMARLMLAILNGGQLDGAVLYGPATAAAFSGQAKSTGGVAQGWAAGFAARSLPGGFAGFGEWGSTLSFSSDLVTIPELNLGVFVTANTESGARLTMALPARIVERFYASAAETPLTGSPSLAAQSKAYNGVYLTTERAYGGLEKFVDSLNGWIRASVTKDGLLVLRGPQFPARAYTADGPTGRFRSIDSLGELNVQYEKNRANQIVVEPGRGAFERLSIWHRLSTLVTLAVLTMAASLGSLIALVTRSRRELRESNAQRRASLLQATIATLWLIALGCFAIWSRNMNDMAKLVYHWPGPALMLASACALVAAILTAACILMGPAVWRGGRRVDSWSEGRKVAFSLHIAISAAFSLVLFSWGALQPWS